MGGEPRNPEPKRLLFAVNAYITAVIDLGISEVVLNILHDPTVRICHELPIPAIYQDHIGGFFREQFPIFQKSFIIGSGIDNGEMGDLHILEQILNGAQIVHLIHHNQYFIPMLHILLPVFIVTVIDIRNHVIGDDSRGGAISHNAGTLEDIVIGSA